MSDASPTAAADTPPQDPGQLQRSVGLTGAVVLGLGSIVGTGAFVSLGLAASPAGAWLPLAVLLAGLLAACNGLSSAQLAAHLPKSGGTYLYASRLLHPAIGLVAGATFLTAKSASAAAAAIGVAGYTLGMFSPQAWPPLLIALFAGSIIVAMTSLVLGGLRRSNVLNALLVAITFVGLGVFVVAAGLAKPGPQLTQYSGASSLGVGLAQATALCFVAYTGYGRVATLGEEIRNPQRNIPRAVIITLVVSAIAYAAVAFAAMYAVGPIGFAQAVEGGATLENVLHMVGSSSTLRNVVAVTGIAAMLGVLLNLLLGLSRVALAMGRQGDLPPLFAKLDKSGQTPVAAVIGVAVVILLVAATGSVKAAWSFSAVTVLIYYGLTNLAALRLQAADRLAPRWVSVVGLIGCLGLTLFLEPTYVMAGLVVVVAAAAWYFLARIVGGEPRVQ
ncbi:MAG: APC family permease [Planctomycetota bacterium]